MPSSSPPLERFSALTRVDSPHGFVQRVPGVDVSRDKAVALANLDEVHRHVRAELGLGRHAFMTVQQVHGSEIAVVDQPPDGDRCRENCDGLITNQRDVALGIYVADCAAVYLADRQQRAAGLVHSGKKGTALAIAPRAIALLQSSFGVEPRDLIVQLSPCIRPPHYEIDFAAEIVRQCRAAGVSEIYDSGICTACDLDHYYSYRAEKGRTGRMLALLAIGAANSSSRVQSRDPAAKP